MKSYLGIIIAVVSETSDLRTTYGEIHQTDKTLQISSYRRMKKFLSLRIKVKLMGSYHVMRWQNNYTTSGRYGFGYKPNCILP